MSDLLEFRLLKYIVAIAETSNIHKASERLYLSQPTLSQQMIALENGIGVQLFTRTKSGTFLTPAGEMLYSYAQDALSQRNEIVKLARALNCREIPVLRMGFSSFASPETMLTLRRTYSRLFPNCPMQMTGGDPAHILRRMEEGQLDAAILPLPVSGAEWKVELIASEPLVVCMRADDPLASKSEIQPSELGQRLKVFRDPSSHPAAHNRLIEMLAKIGIHPDVSCLATTPTDIQMLVQTECGLAMIGQNSVLDSSLTTRPILSIRWTLDTAFIRHISANHIALSTIARHLPRPKRMPVSKSPMREMNAVQLRLLA